MTGFLGGLKSIQQSASVGWVSMRDSMKESMKVSLAETWGISVADLEEIMLESESDDCNGSRQRMNSLSAFERAIEKHQIEAGHTILSSSEIDGDNISQSSHRSAGVYIFKQSILKMMCLRISFFQI